MKVPKLLIKIPAQNRARDTQKKPKVMRLIRLTTIQKTIATSIEIQKTAEFKGEMILLALQP